MTLNVVYCHARITNDNSKKLFIKLRNCKEFGSSPACSRTRDRILQIALIEANKSTARALKAALARKASFPCQFQLAASLKEGLSALNEKPCDVVLLDSSLPDSDPVSAVSRVRAEFPSIPILVLSPSEDTNFVKMMHEYGAHPYAIKGTVDGVRLEEAINQAIAQGNTLKEENVLLKKNKETQSENIKTFAALLQGLKGPSLMTERILQVVISERFGSLPSGMASIFSELRSYNCKTLKMINQLLAIYEYEIDMHTMEFEPVKLSELVEEALALIDTSAQARNVTINSEVENGDKIVQLNKSGMLMALLTLLEMAITNTGLDCALSFKTVVDENSVSITVDNINPLDKRNDEGSFERLPPTSEPGLHFCKAIAEAHSGELLFRLEDTLDCKFIFRVPTSH